MGRELRMSMGPGQDDSLRDELGEEPESGELDGREYEDDFIPRRDTALRIALTVLFVIVASVVETLLGLIVFFELVASLVTQRPPSERVRELANRIVSYYYRIGRYLTYNESRVPFPFDEFPAPVEGDAFRPGASESKALGLEGAGEGVRADERESD